MLSSPHFTVKETVAQTEEEMWPGPHGQGVAELEFQFSVPPDFLCPRRWAWVCWGPWQRAKGPRQNIRGWGESLQPFACLLQMGKHDRTQCSTGSRTQDFKKQNASSFHSPSYFLCILQHPFLCPCHLWSRRLSVTHPSGCFPLRLLSHREHTPAIHCPSSSAGNADRASRPT